MIPSNKCYDLIKSVEQCRLYAYPDVKGVWTIGWGHTHGVRDGMICTQADADRWLEEDVQNASNAVNNLVKVMLTQNQFDALVSFVFNVGAGEHGFGGSTMLRLLNISGYNSAANEFDRWVYSGGKRYHGLEDRRAREKALFNEA